MSSTSQSIEEWPEWAKKVVNVAKIEAQSRPLIKNLLADAKRGYFCG